MSFGFRCVNRYTAAQKVEAAHGLPCEEPITSFGPQREKGICESEGSLQLLTCCARGRDLLCAAGPHHTSRAQEMEFYFLDFFSLKDIFSLLCWRVA